MSKKSKRASRKKRKQRQPQGRSLIVNLESLKLLYEQEKYDEVAEHCRRLSDQERTRDHCLLYGSSLERSEKYEEAAKAFALIPDKGPYEYWLIGSAYFYATNWELAIENFLRSLELHEDARAHYWIARAYAGNASYYTPALEVREKIIHHLHAAINLPNCPSSAVEWLEDLLPWEHLSERIAVLEKGLAADEGSEELRIRLAMRHLFSLENPNTALEVLRPTADLPDAPARSLWYTHLACEKLGLDTEAVEYLRKLRSLYPKDELGVGIILARLCYRLGSFEEAINAIDDVVEEIYETSRIRALFVRAYAFLAKNDLQNAIRDAKEASFIWFDKAVVDAEEYVYVGDTFVGHYDFSEEISAVCRYLTNVEGQLTHEDLGRLQLILSLVSDDEKSLTLRSLSIENYDHPFTKGQLVSAMIEEGMYDTAVDYHLTYQLWLQSKFVEDGKVQHLEFDPSLTLDVSCIKTKKLARDLHKIALEFLRHFSDQEAVLRVFVPFYISFWRSLLWEKKLWREIVETVRGLSAHGPSSSSLLFDLAFALNEIDKKEESTRAYRELIDMEPNHSAALHNLSIILANGGFLNEALELTDRAVRIDPNKELYVNWNRQVRDLTVERAREEEEQKSIREQIVHIFTYEHQPIIDIAQLDLDDAMFLLSLARLGLAEDYETINSLNSLPGRLSPTLEYDYEILRRLKNANLIGVSLRTPYTEFELKDDTAYYNISRVTWLPRFGSGAHEVKMVIEGLERIVRDGDWPEQWNEQWQSLWLELALHECIAYFQHQMGQRGFLVEVGDKTKALFSRMLETYSISKCYYFLWSTARDAADEVQKGKYGTSVAASTVLGRIQRRVDKAIAEGWSIRDYKREYKQPASTLYELFVIGCLKIGDDGFNECPTTYVRAVPNRPALLETRSDVEPTS